MSQIPLYLRLCIASADNGGGNDDDDGLARIVVHDARASGPGHVLALPVWRCLSFVARAQVREIAWLFQTPPNPFGRVRFFPQSSNSIASSPSAPASTPLSSLPSTPYTSSTSSPASQLRLSLLPPLAAALARRRAPQSVQSHASRFLQTSSSTPSSTYSTRTALH